MKKYNISFLTVLITLSFILIDGTLYSLYAVLFSFLHEIAHISALKLVGGRVKGLHTGAVGVGLDTTCLSYTGEAVVAIAGPLMSLFLFFCFLPFCAKSPILFFCCFSNLIIFILNILPVYPLDGGRVLYCLLCKKLSLSTAVKITKSVSFLFLLPLLFISVIILINTGYNVSLLVISIYLLSVLVGVKNL